VTLRMRSRKRGHGVSRQIGHVGQDGLMRAKFDGRPKTHNRYVDGVGLREDEPTKIDPKFPKKLKYLFWTVRESRGILFHQVNGNPAKAIVSRHFHCCIHWIFAAMY